MSLVAEVWMPPAGSERHPGNAPGERFSRERAEPFMKSQKKPLRFFG